MNYAGLSIESSPFTWSEPGWILFAVFLSFLGGFLIRFFGVRWPRETRISFLVLVGVQFLIWVGQLVQQMKDGFKPKIWVFEWASVFFSGSAVPAGVTQDVGSILVILLTLLLSAGVISLLLWNENQKRIEILICQYFIALGGFELCWVAATPWVGFFGISLLLFGILFEGREIFLEETYSSRISLLIREIGIGLLIAVGGSCILMGSKGDSAQYWGASVFSVGLLMGMRCFPFLGWIRHPEEGHWMRQLVFFSLLPGWALFSFFYKSEPMLSKNGVFPLVAWISLSLFLLSLIPGLFQVSFEKCIALSVQLAALFGVLALSFSGRLAGLRVFLGAGVISIVLLLLFSSPQKGKKSARTNWLPYFAVFWALVSGGLIGFLPSSGYALLFYPVLDQTAALIGLTFVFFVFMVWQWKLFWILIDEGKKEIGRVQLIALIILMLASVSYFYTGDLSGGLLGSGKLWDGSFFLKEGMDEWASRPVLQNDSHLPWILISACMVVSWVAVFWAFRSKKRFFQSFPSRFKGAHQFLSGGFYLEEGVENLVAGFQGIALVLTQKLIEPLGAMVNRIFWKQGVRFLVKWTNVGGDRITNFWNLAIEKTLIVPGKAVQLIHNGDVQWYLLFALIVGFTIIAHFLMN